MSRREDRILSLGDNEWFKYRHVAKRAGLKKGEKIVSFYYHADGSLDERKTYSDAYLSYLNASKTKNHNEFGVSEAAETAVDEADEAIEEFLDCLPWPLNWLAILLWWIIKIIWMIVSFPIKLIISFFD